MRWSRRVMWKTSVFYVYVRRVCVCVWHQQHCYVTCLSMHARFSRDRPSHSSGPGTLRGKGHSGDAHTSWPGQSGTRGINATQCFDSRVFDLLKHFLDCSPLSLMTASSCWWTVPVCVHQPGVCRPGGLGGHGGQPAERRPRWSSGQQRCVRHAGASPGSHTWPVWPVRAGHIT